jgi:hypothetical protein
MPKRWTQAAAIFVAIFAIIFGVASWVVHDLEGERERSCAERCNAKGFTAYTYKGFSGASRGFLGVDSCTCNDTSGTSSNPAK